MRRRYYLAGHRFVCSEWVHDRKIWIQRVRSVTLSSHKLPAVGHLRGVVSHWNSSQISSGMQQSGPAERQSSIYGSAANHTGWPWVVAGLKIFTTTLAVMEGLAHAALRNGMLLFLCMVIIIWLQAGWPVQFDVFRWKESQIDYRFYVTAIRRICAISCVLPQM